MLKNRFDKTMMAGAAGIWIALAMSGCVNVAQQDTQASSAATGAPAVSAAAATAASDAAAAASLQAAATAAAERLRDTDGGITAGLLDLHASREKVAARQVVLRQRFASGHPTVPTVVVPALAGDVHDLDGLREVGDLMAQAEA